MVSAQRVTTIETGRQQRAPPAGGPAGYRDRCSFLTEEEKKL
jgi:hypothetical protein